MKIQPVDNFIREGFSKQMTKQFRCPAIFTTGIDKLRVLKTMLGNKQPEYPYMFLSLQSVGPNTESYTTHRLSKQGIPVLVNTDNNQVQLARLIPVNFEVEVTFVTNKYSGELDSVEGFARRWLFARRIGSLNFNVDYGMTQLSISYSLGESVPFQPKENPAEQESVHIVVATATVHGYISEPELGFRGRINQILLTENPPVQDGGQFFPFHK